MLETPRSCIAKDLISIECGRGKFRLKASFFSKARTTDANDIRLRDDSSFFQAYEREKVALVDPFEILDWDGVGRLIKIALDEITAPDEITDTKASATRRLAEVSACGEHAAEPKSIEFFVRNAVDGVSCSAFRVLGARLSVAKAQIQVEDEQEQDV